MQDVEGGQKCCLHRWQNKYSFSIYLRKFSNGTPPCEKTLSKSLQGDNIQLLRDSRLICCDTLEGWSRTLFCPGLPPGRPIGEVLFWSAVFKHIDKVQGVMRVFFFSFVFLASWRFPINWLCIQQFISVKSRWLQYRWPINIILTRVSLLTCFGRVIGDQV